MSPVRPVVAPVAEHLLRTDLPGLPDERRRRVIAFTCDRVEGLPDLTRLGVLSVAWVVRGLCSLPGGRRAVTALAHRPVPLVAEYVRLLRSLATAHVWETWPDTQPDGTPGESVTA